MTAPRALQDEALARECARAMCDAFADYNAAFRHVTRRARQRFETRDWAGMQADTVERIELYEQHVQRTMGWLKDRLDERLNDRELWQRIKVEFDNDIRYYLDREFTRTFFSSISRRIFRTVGVDSTIEFVALDARPIRKIRKPPELNTVFNHGSLQDLSRTLLSYYPFNIRWINLEHSVSLMSDRIRAHCEALGGGERLMRVECMRPVFYQGTRAYIVGRLVGRDFVEPLMVALASDEDGLRVDAVLTEAPDVSILFGFTRSYFHADLETVGDAVAFLKSILPRKPVSEIYTVLGRAKQGKTERYRSFFRHLGLSHDQIIAAPGDKGMVMIVFTLPSYDIVFKVIRDRFAYPKTMGRREVKEKYQLVFKHDRAGRLVDAQEFRMLKFHRDRFEADILKELLEEATETVSMEGDDVVIRHAYVERRMAPLNLYLRSASADDARRAVLEYGQSIRDLASNNIFPGDLLLKNFGVTRNGRVIFYDYDELCLVTECVFRNMPQASTLEEEMQGDTWFYVGEDDVFPEQFISFLGLPKDLLDVFLEVHGEILTAAWWNGLKKRHEAGETIERLPYREELALPPPQTPAQEPD